MSGQSELISELKFKKYGQALDQQQFSNIDLLATQSEFDQHWQECNTGCHVPTYRRLKRNSTWNEVVEGIQKDSPLIANFVDGAHHEVIHKPTMMVRGTRRTAEGLHLLGSERFRKVGSENSDMFYVSANVLQALFSVDITKITNPLMQIVYIVVYEYIYALPEPLLEEMLVQGALKFPDGIDSDLVLNIVKLGLTKGLDAASVADVIDIIETNIEVRQKITRLKQQAKETTTNKVGEIAAYQAGKRVARAIAAVIASHIVKKVLYHPKISGRIKRTLEKLFPKKKGRYGPGGLITSLTILLRAQGFLDVAGQDSRRLQRECPGVYNFLKLRLGSTHILYFIIRETVQEYIDRIHMFENEPTKFFKILSILVKDKKTEEIFFPMLSS